MVGTNFQIAMLRVAQTAPPAGLGWGIPEMIVIGLFLAVIVLAVKWRPAILIVLGVVVLPFFLLRFWYAGSTYTVNISQPASVSTDSTTANPWHDRRQNASISGSRVQSSMGLQGPPIDLQGGPQISWGNRQIHSSVNVRWTFAKVFLLLLVGGFCVVALKLFKQRNHSSAEGELWHAEPLRRSWLGWAAAGMFLLIFAGLLLPGFYKGQRITEAGVSNHMALARQQAAVDMELVQQRAAVEIALAQQRASMSQAGAQQNIHKLMDEYDKPRIEIESPQGSSKPDAAGGDPASAPSHGPANDAPVESVIEVAEVSTSPDENAAKFADAKRAASKDEPKEASGVVAIAASGSSNGRTVEEFAAAPQVSPRPEKTIIVAMNQEKMRRFRFSFNQIAQTLNRKKVWQGAVRTETDAPRLEITAVGDLPKSGEIPAVLLGTVNDRPVYLRDVATITEKSLGVVTQGGPRPAWVDAPSQRFGGTLREVIEAGDYSTTQECIKATKELVMIAVWDHVQTLVEHYDEVVTPLPDYQESIESQRQRANWASNMLSEIGVTQGYIRAEIVTAEHLEEVDRSVGKMQKMYAQLEFTPQVDAYLKHQWVAKAQSWRTYVVSAIAATSLACISLVWGLLKVDTWTKGYYSKRLFLGVPAAIIGIAFLLDFIANQ